MIHLTDSATLALTKLRTRKVRLVVTIIVAGLLFSALAGASIVVRGMIDGVQRFSEEGFGSRYIVQGSGNGNFSFFNDPQVLERAVAIQKDIIAQKKAEAKRLGIDYESAGEAQPVQEYNDPLSGKQQYLVPNSPAAKQAISEYFATHPQSDQTAFANIAAPYNPIGVYSSKQLSYDLDGARLQVLKGGKEELSPKQQNGPSTGTESFVGSWTEMNSELLKPFILSGQNLKTGADGSIPIIVPRSAAEQILGLKALPASADAKERLERTKEIRTKAPTVSFTLCYRNSASVERLQTALAAAAEAEKNKDNKNYQKPALMYGLPTTPCGSIPVTRDVRSTEEKRLADKQHQFDVKFGAVDPKEATFTFRIVGIVPDANYGQSFSMSQIIDSLVTSSLGNGWYSPSEEIAKQPLLTEFFNLNTNLYGSSGTYYAEFKTAEAARKFIDKENCALDYGKLKQGEDPNTYCAKQNHPFSVGPYGSNSLGLESAKKGFGKVFRIAALIVSAVAAIIMMGIVGRMIADSRRETAVFRAIGAKRLDIAQIYVLYAVFLSLLISAFAISIGGIGALILDHLYSSDVTIAAVTAFNAQDLTKTFPLYAFYWPDMLLIVGLAVASGLISASFPLLRNLRRNPIRDMRDEN